MSDESENDGLENAAPAPTAPHSEGQMLFVAEASAESSKVLSRPPPKPRRPSPPPPPSAERADPLPAEPTQAATGSIRPMPMIKLGEDSRRSESPPSAMERPSSRPPPQMRPLSSGSFELPPPPVVPRGSFEPPLAKAAVGIEPASAKPAASFDPPPPNPGASFDPPTEPRQAFDPPTQPRLPIEPPTAPLIDFDPPTPEPDPDSEEDRITPDARVNGVTRMGAELHRSAPPPPSARAMQRSAPTIEVLPAEMLAEMLPAAELEDPPESLESASDLPEVDVTAEQDLDAPVTAEPDVDIPVTSDEEPIADAETERISVESLDPPLPVVAAPPPPEEAAREAERTATRKPPPPPKRTKVAPAPAPSEGAVAKALEAHKFEGPSSKQRAKPWWEELFTDDFGRAILPTSEKQVRREVDFIEESLAVAKGGVVLDLACGTGNHAVELSARGYGVVGFDLSLPQLATAGENAQARGQKINFLQGDMRDMSFEEVFDGIYCWNTSFGYFEEEKNVAVAQRVFNALRPGGSFLLDVVNRDFVVVHQPSSVWFEGDSCVCMDDMSVDFITSRLRVKRTMMLDDGRTRECAFSIRMYSLHELGKLLHEIGFRVTEASGHPAYPGVFFGATSPRIMILAQKP